MSEKARAQVYLVRDEQPVQRPAMMRGWGQRLQQQWHERAWRALRGCAAAAVVSDGLATPREQRTLVAQRTPFFCYLIPRFYGAVTPITRRAGAVTAQVSLPLLRLAAKHDTSHHKT